jgi:hypothetical protein
MGRRRRKKCNSSQQKALPERRSVARYTEENRIVLTKKIGKGLHDGGQRRRLMCLRRCYAAGISMGQLQGEVTTRCDTENRASRDTDTNNEVH